ncbi:MAG: YjbH domain-containing protein [Betaproteobacteria bacterium]|nr:YjbH domain-containing protein [Betaproteobacteria bacterium]
MRACSCCVDPIFDALALKAGYLRDAALVRFWGGIFSSPIKNRSKLVLFYLFLFLCGSMALAQSPVSIERNQWASRVSDKVSEPIMLSDWLLSLPRSNDNYPLGLVWTTPEAKNQQLALQDKWLNRLEQLRVQGRISADVWFTMQRMMRSLPATGRVRLAAAEPHWLKANPQRDAVILPADSVRLPRRPGVLRLVNELGQACEVPHLPGALANDYLRVCWPQYRAQKAWLVQPDGRIHRLGLRPWNPEFQDEPAPGAWLWVPSDAASLPEDVSLAWAQWLAYHGLSNEMPDLAFSNMERKEAPIKGAKNGWDWAGQRFDPKPSASDWGIVGLLQTPTARMRTAGHFGLNFVRLQPLNFANVIFQPLDWMEGGFRYIDVENRLYGPQDFSGDLPYKDKSLDLKLRAWRESEWLPELAVGWRDIAGTGLYSSEYLVASKRWGRWDASLGLGWGYLGNRGDVRNPLSSLLGGKMDVRQNDIGQGGNFSTESWFRGDAAWFGGLEYQSPWKTVFKLEYDGNNYQREPQDNNQAQKTPLNLGLVYRPTSGLDVSVGYERGTTWTLGLTFYTDMSALAVPKVTAPPVPAVRMQRPQTEPDWQATAADIDKLTLWRTRQIYRQDQTLVLEAADTSHPYTGDRLEKALAVLQRDAPAEVERFEIHHHAVGDVLAVETVDRQSWAQARTSAPRMSDPVLVQGPLYDPPSTRGLALLPPKKFHPYFEPGMDFLPTLGGPNGFLYQLRASAFMRMDMPWNLRLSGTAAHRLVDNYDQFVTPGAGAALPRVRTYLREYLITARTTLENLTLSKSERLGRDWYGSAYAGYFESMFGGVGSEVLYRQPGSTWAFGLDVNRVQQRSFAQDFEFRPYQYTTGHLTAYWATPFEGVHASLSVGQYLAEDQGATLTLSKRFANGSIIGGFVTKTNVSAEEFGEGSFDKGIFWIIPFEAFLTSPSRFVAGFSWKPLTRDGGAKLVRPLNLYPQTQWMGSDAKAYAPAPPWNETVPPDDRLEPWQRKR